MGSLGLLRLIADQYRVHLDEAQDSRSYGEPQSSRSSEFADG
jgi:hypothetical protein